MRRLIPFAAFGLLVLAAIGEVFILASIDDHHHRAGHVKGLDVAMDPAAAQVVAWVVVVLVGLVLAAAIVNRSLYVFIGVMTIAIAIVANWASELPSPQDRWDYALVYAAGFLTAYVVTEERVRNWLRSLA